MQVDRRVDNVTLEERGQRVPRQLSSVRLGDLVVELATLLL